MTDPDPAGALRNGAHSSVRDMLRRRPTARRRAVPPRRSAPGGGSHLVIEVAEPCPLWRGHLPDVAPICRDAATAALVDAGTLGVPAELSIVLADDGLLQALNRQWRGQDKATNVLSFPALTRAPPPGAPHLLGDVVLAFETIRSEAQAQGKPLSHHLRHLVIHGILHLLGFAHETAAEAERMEAIETAVLARLGVPDPYRASEARHG